MGGFNSKKARIEEYNLTSPTTNNAKSEVLASYNVNKLKHTCSPQAKKWIQREEKSDPDLWDMFSRF